MVLILPVNLKGAIKEIKKDIFEIEKEVDKILKARHNFTCDFGKYPDYIIINEHDYLFLKHYLNNPSLSIHYGTGLKTDNLFGMKVMKMKAKGFVFAYE
jgi:hypothetical protein